VLVIETGGPDGHSITGLDPRTGKLLWSNADDSVTYQSPLALDIDGNEVIFAVTNEHLIGLDPRTGKILWNQGNTSEEHFEKTQPVPVAGNGVLLTDRAGAVLYRVSSSSGRYQVEEAWRSKAFRAGTAVPVPHDGYIYGFTTRRFLSCVDATSGEVVWKSRQPGGGELVLVDDQLVILAPNGDVVVSAATPEGYREKARTKALERGYVVRPSFSGGRVFVRNLSELAAVGVTEKAATDRVASTPEAAPSEGARGVIAELISKVAAAADKQQVVDEFMSEHQEYPILDDDNLIHFIYRGEVPDLTLICNSVVWEREQMMHRVAGTDLYYLTQTLEPEARFEYAFGIFDEQRLDPLNPRVSEIEGRERSLLTTRGWQEAAHLQQPQGARGRFETLSWKSEILDNERQLHIYLPPGYDSSEQLYPLLLFYQRDQANEISRIDVTLDNLIGKTIAPVIVAFVPQYHFTESGTQAPHFIDALAAELLPLLDRSYRTQARAESRAMMGNEFAGLFAFYVVIQRPDLFSMVAAQSPIASSFAERLFAAIDDAAKTDLSFVIEWTDHEHKSQGRTAGERITELLVKKGYEPTTRVIPGGFGWGAWRQSNDHILQTLFPAVN
jgi:enterochelin esterase-like enzyme